MAEEGEVRGRDFVMVEDERSESEPSSSDQRTDLPAIDFSTFIISLGTSALFHMGLAPDPSSGAASGEKNLPLAKQTIDTLVMIEAKTRGNLDEEEAKLVSSLVYELRIRFVEAGDS